MMTPHIHTRAVQAMLMVAIFLDFTAVGMIKHMLPIYFNDIGVSNNGVLLGASPLR